MFCEEKKQVLDAALDMLRYRLVALCGGNVTLKVGEDRYLITPSGMRYDRMTPDDILLINRKGGVLEGSRRPSVDTAAIMDVFDGIPWVNCVIHTHQPYTTAVGLVDDEFPACLTTLLDFTLGPVRVAPYLPTADRDMGKLAVQYAGGSLAVILKHHGVMTFGKTVDEALYAAVYMEEAAKSYMAARPLCAPASFDPAEIEHVREEALRYGQIG